MSDFVVLTAYWYCVPCDSWQFKHEPDQCQSWIVVQCHRWLLFDTHITVAGDLQRGAELRMLLNFLREPTCHPLRKISYDHAPRPRCTCKRVLSYSVQGRALLMFVVHDNRCPVYLSESVHPVSSNTVRQRIRYASSVDYIVPRTKTKFGDWAFSVAGPTVWNSLSESVSKKRCT